MRRMRVITLGGLAAAAITAAMPMLSAQAQTTLLPPRGGTYSSGSPAGSPASAGADPAMTMSASPLGLQVASQLAAAREATAKFSTNLNAAKAAGYKVITPMMPNMGIHFLNPTIAGFNIRKPQILVYEHTGKAWQLGALEWVFTKMPATPPLPNATFGSFPAACHYNDGNFIPEPSQSKCPAKEPKTGAKFFFWHPDLITMHVWAWYPNPAGLYSSTNPLVAPFNKG
jgi:hypothetical protein